MNTIKTRRAMKLAHIGKYPRTWTAILSAIPQDVVAALTAQQIASLADAMRGQYEVGHSVGYEDAIAENAAK